MLRILLKSYTIFVNIRPLTLNMEPQSTDLVGILLILRQPQKTIVGEHW